MSNVDIAVQHEIVPCFNMFQQVVSTLGSRTLFDVTSRMKRIHLCEIYPGIFNHVSINLWVNTSS